MQLDSPRPLNEAEHQVLDALLANEFPGAPELREQVPHVMVVEQCDCGCPTVNLYVPEGIPSSPVKTRSRLAPVEGHVIPIGEEPIGDIILFVDEGKMTSLEYVSYVDPAPTEWPDLGRITINRTD
jgi:hypothetical protein